MSLFRPQDKTEYLAFCGASSLLPCSAVTENVPFRPQDKTEWTVTGGYTVGEFWGLVLQTVCLPGATVALLTSMLFFYKSPAWPSWVSSSSRATRVFRSFCLFCGVVSLFDRAGTSLQNFPPSHSRPSGVDAERESKVAPEEGMLAEVTLPVFDLPVGGEGDWMLRTTSGIFFPSTYLRFLLSVSV